MHRIALTAFFIFFSLFSFATYDFNNNCKQAYKEIVDLKFDEGRKLLEAEKATHPIILSHISLTII